MKCRWYVWPRHGQPRRRCGDCGYPPINHDGERRQITVEGEGPPKWNLHTWLPSEAEHLS